MIDYDKINLNEYALKLRRDGKTFKQIGDELGVSRERARQRVAWASRHEKKLERHEAATTMGDCEDYALRKRQILMERGVDPSLLKLATCWTETKDYHAVLIDTTSDGDFILDNRMKSPMIKQDIGYTWDKIQIGSKWYKL